MNGKTTVAQLHGIVGTLVVKDMIQQFYARASRERALLDEKKRKHGFCAGSPSCMQYTGEARMCDKCKKARSNPRSTHPRFEYGLIRMAERAKAREEEKKKQAKKGRKVA